MTNQRISFGIVALLLACGGPALAHQPPDHPTPATDVPVPAGQWQGLLQRLDAIEEENARLRTESAELRRLVSPQNSAVRPADFHAPVSEACDDCPDCGKKACKGLPHLCGVCLDKLSWNKTGGWRIVPFGRLRAEAIYSSAPQTGDAVIVFLNPNNPGVSEDQATIHAKQSQVNFALTGPQMGAWQTGGTFLMNFMGAQPLRNFSGANIVLAYGELKNERWRFAFGRMLDLFGPLNPATVNQLQQRGAGNVGIYRGALHLDRFLTGDNAKGTLSARISQQDISDYSGDLFVRGRDNGWPNVETRVGVELGPECDFGRPLTVGVSAVWGEMQAVADRIGDFLRAEEEVTQTRAFALDLEWKSERFGFRTEVWWGSGAGTYFVAVLQSLNPNDAQAIESIGGWGEVYYKINPRLTTHVGYGVDDPENGDLGIVNEDIGVGQTSFNDVAWCNMIWNVTDAFELATEFSYRRTNYLDPQAANEGFLVHFASTLNF